MLKKFNPCRVLLIVAVFVATTAAQAESVFVPGDASGYFGQPVNVVVPLTPALTVTGRGTITVSYVDGMVDYGTGVAGPNGVLFDKDGQSPLEEGQGFPPGPGLLDDFSGLIGAFVPQSRVDRVGFIAVDSTKLSSITRSGIMPCELFFVGSSMVVHAQGPGTLFLGINDSGVADNSGGFNVEVTTP